MRRNPSAERVLATVLFTDIVGSTERAAELGDRRWRELVARHHAVVRAQLKHFRGREIDTAGDGFLASFDRPARAIDCALAIIEALRPLGLAIRAGVHAGELEVTGGKLGGIAVHTAARVVAAAGPGEVLVTATVRELVAGSQIEFIDRGTATLKGVPGEWHLFAVVTVGPVLTDGAEMPGPESVATSSARTRLSRLWGLIGIAAVVMLLVIAAVVALPLLLAPALVPGNDTVARVDVSGTGFDRSVPVGARPIGLAAGDGAIWAISFETKTLTRIGDELNVPPGSAVGGAPTGITYGADAVWITTGFGLSSGQAGAVLRISPRLQQTEANIPVGSGVGAITFGEDAVWVTDRVHDVLLRINPATYEEEARVSVARTPVAVVVGAGSVWVASSLDDVLQRLDDQTYMEDARLSVNKPTAMALGPDALWITSELADTVTRVDLTTNAGTTVPVDGPRGVAVAEDGVWVALGPVGQLVRIDPATVEIEERLEVDGFADAVVVDELGRVWVSVHRL